MLPMNERNILKVLKESEKANIGFEDEAMTQVILTNGVFMLMTDINNFKPGGRLMATINEAKAALLAENKVGQMYDLIRHGIAGLTVEYVQKTFSNFAKAQKENGYALPFSATVYDGGKTECQALFLLANGSYVAFDNRYMELLKNRVLLKDGCLVKVPYTVGTGKKFYYPLVVDSEVYRFACMPFYEPHRALTSYLVKK